MNVSDPTAASAAESRTERVLLVEDDESLADLLVEELEEAGYAVRAVRTAEAALTAFEEERIDLVVTDLRLPEASGRDLLERFQESHLPPAFVMITAFGSVPQAVEALRAGADDFLTKPLDLDHFRVAVDRALEKRRLRRRVEEYDRILGRDHFHGLVGSSRPMTELFEMVRRVASGSGPVLITGESGTGKELVARALHAESDRSARQVSSRSTSAYSLPRTAIWSRRSERVRFGRTSSFGWRPFTCTSCRFGSAGTTWICLSPTS